MRTRFFPADGRGHAEHGWLSSYFSFSFADFYDPNLTGFGALRVLNDDIIAPNAGFPPHGHRDMEIITIPLSGALTHADNMGHQEVIRAGDVQVMSAGSGVIHSEFNASAEEPVSLFQIWIHTAVPNVAPRYDQTTFNWQSAPRDEFLLLVSPDARTHSLAIHQNAFISVTTLTSPRSYTPHDVTNNIYLLVISGSVRVGEYTLRDRDALGVVNEPSVLIEPLSPEACVLVIEVPE